MNTVAVLLVSIACLAAGYIFYGGWLAKQWGVDEKKKTPAVEMEDDVDYVPTKTPVLMGHHFSSIAGAGPINGPIQAAVFGWVPVLLWVLLGGIFMGGVHDFGALFASLRNKGHSIGEIISDTMGQKAKRLFLVFAYLTLILVIAAFGSIVASTFGTTKMDGSAVAEPTLSANLSTAMISILFIVLAVIVGQLMYRVHMKVLPASLIGVVGIVGIIALGLNWHPVALTYNTWMWVVGAYIIVAAVLPVWLLLQPRDYLSSFLLYFMIAASIVGVIGSAVKGGANVDIPAFTGWTANVDNGLFASGTMFPALFVTIACGAVSGFHSLVSSGTTSKQLDNEKHARPVAYGSMLIESVLAVVSLCAIGYVWKDAYDGKFAAPTQVFATGVSTMLGSFTSEAVQKVMYQMLILAISVFCLTSLDTCARLARYMFQEFWLKEGEDVKDVKGARAILVNPWFATILTVVAGITLGMTGYTKIWPLFGAANQLLAAVGLLAVCAWLGSVGRNNKMFYFPMMFMLVVTCTSLLQTIIKKFTALAAGFDGWALAQAFIAIFLVALAVDLAVMTIVTLFKQHSAKADAAETKKAA